MVKNTPAKQQTQIRDWPVILNAIRSEYSLKGLMLKLQYFSHLMRRNDLLEKTLCWERLKVGGERDNRGWDGWMIITNLMDRSLSKLQESVMDREVWVCCSPWGHKEMDTTEQLNWIKLATYKTMSPSCISFRGPEAVSLSPSYSVPQRLFPVSPLIPLMWMVPEWQIQIYVPASYLTDLVSVYSSTEGCTFMLFYS